MKGEINLTRAGLANAAQRGISPTEIWQVIDSHERVINPVRHRRESPLRIR